MEEVCLFVCGVWRVEEVCLFVLSSLEQISSFEAYSYGVVVFAFTLQCDIILSFFNRR